MKRQQHLPIKPSAAPAAERKKTAKYHSMRQRGRCGSQVPRLGHVPRRRRRRCHGGGGAGGARTREKADCRRTPSSSEGGTREPELDIKVPSQQVSNNIGSD
uniref:Uncharacterized protein n=1 Tax=Oryza punctata TaxID=4537 RepID=A0A0E0M591_ORYPU